MKKLQRLNRPIVSDLIVTGLMMVMFTGLAMAGTASMSWYKAGTGSPTLGNILVCGVPPKVDFKVSYAGSNCSGTWGSNPFRYEFFLYKDGVQVGYIPNVNSSNCSIMQGFYSMDAHPGNYKATVKFQKRVTLTGWMDVDTQSTNIIVSTKSPANPYFKINQKIASNFNLIEVNIGEPLIIDASGTSCASFYNVGVHESDASLNRTYKYEWWKWFTGTPSANINLQQLATTYSYGQDYLGTDLSRQGTVLFGGDLSPGVPRHYRVNVCTNEPTWACQSALLRIKYP
jgi:hypothetical protein